jgi:hypothetical protein
MSSAAERSTETGCSTRTSTGSVVYVVPSSDNPGGGLRHLLEVDPSLLSRDVVGLLEKDPASLQKLLEKLELCQTVALQAMKSSALMMSDQFVVVGIDDQDHHPSSHTHNHCTTTEKKTTHRTTKTSPHQSDLDIDIDIPVEVLHQVCQSEFLTAEEVGRLLLLVSKSFIYGLGKERTWEIICCKNWRSTVDIPRSIIDQRGYEWLFRQRSKGIINIDDGNHQSVKRIIAPPILSPETLTLLISIRNAKNKEVVSLTLKDDELRMFLQNGELNVALQDPVPLGLFPVTEDGIIGFDLDTFCSDFCQWKATMHFIRSDQLQCACVHETSQCSWGEYDYCVDPTVPVAEETTAKPLKVDISNLVPSGKEIGEVKPPIVEVDMGYLEFSTCGNGLELTVMGNSFEERIREHESNPEDTFQAVKIEPTLLCFTEDFQDSLNAVELVFSELRLDVWKSYRSGAAVLFHSGSESKKHGITLLHILDHLASWEDKQMATVSSKH